MERDAQDKNTSNDQYAPSAYDVAIRATAYLVIYSHMLGAYYEEETLKWAKSIMSDESRVGITLIREVMKLPLANPRGGIRDYKIRRMTSDGWTEWEMVTESEADSRRRDPDFQVEKV